LDGETVQHIEYVPFGEVFIEERNNTWNTPYLFNAKELDEETGLYYYGARYYDPRVSIWLSTDPLQEKYPNISTYAYCSNNPVMFVDPDGRENISALLWAATNMANKGISSSYSNPYFGGSDNRWKYTIGTVPDRTVCYESCFMAYLNSGDDVLPTLRTGFTNKNNSFFGRSTPNGGMNWFKAGDGTDRQFVSDITKGELGDVVFMGENGEMAGHAVLLASEIATGTTKINGKEAETVSFYALSTSSDTDSGNYGGRTFTFVKQSDGNWTQSGGAGYKFRGFGQMKNIDATEQQRTDVLKAIDDVKGGN
jgi:RHS repeat-associated protein